MTRLNILMVVAAMVLVSGTAMAEHTRVTNPNALGVEVLGRGLTYSVNFDRVVSDELAGGIGFGSASLTGDFEESLVTVPMYLNYYLVQDAGSLFLTGGLTLLLDSGDGVHQTSLGKIELPDSGLVPTVGLGYENRGDFGFLMRVSAYALIADEIAPWVGFTIGYAF